MAGMKMYFQPTSSLILFSLAAVGTNSVAKCGGAVGMVVGTGEAPNRNDPLTGQLMISMKIFDVAFAGQRVPISFTDFWGYLIPGQTYWLDADWNTAVGGNFTLYQITICVASV